MTLMAKETAVAAMAGKQPSLVPAAIAEAFRKLNPRGDARCRKRRALGRF